MWIQQHGVPWHNQLIALLKVFEGTIILALGVASLRP